MIHLTTLFYSKSLYELLQSNSKRELIFKQYSVKIFLIKASYIMYLLQKQYGIQEWILHNKELPFIKNYCYFKYHVLNRFLVLFLSTLTKIKNILQ